MARHNTHAPRNLVQGILDYRRESMRTAYGTEDKAYILAEAPDHTGTLIGFVGKVSSILGDLFPVGKHGKVSNERELRELVRRLPMCMQAFCPDMIYVAPISAFRHCYPRSGLAGTDPEKLSAAQLAEEVNSLGAKMRVETSRLAMDEDIASCGCDAEFNALKVQSEISALFRSGEALTVIRLKLPYIRAACKDESQALDAKERIFERKRRIAAALMNGELEPVIDLGLPHTSATVVSADVDRYVDALYDKTKDLPVRSFVLSVDYSMFSGFYVEATIFLAGDLAGEDGSLADEFGELWLLATEGRGFFLNYNAKGHALSGVFEAKDPARLTSLLFNLKCAAMKDQFFFPKSAVGMQTFIVESIRQTQGGEHVD